MVVAHGETKLAKERITIVLSDKITVSLDATLQDAAASSCLFDICLRVTGYDTRTSSGPFVLEKIGDLSLLPLFIFNKPLIACTHS